MIENGSLPIRRYRQEAVSGELRLERPPKARQIRVVFPRVKTCPIYEFSPYDNLALPVRVLHGTESDLLLPEIAEAMGRRRPRAKIVQIAGCGHAPGLNTRAQCAIVREFIERTCL